MDPVTRFTRLVNAPDEAFDLARACLAVAAGADPRLRTHHWLQQLDRLAAGVEGLDHLTHRLFIEQGFAGNTQKYYDPANSLLNRVLQRRLGIPITLSVVLIEVGRRAGVTLEGVGMPGHFLVRHPASGWYVDAFHGGALLSERGCAERFRQVAGDDAPFGLYLLPTVGPKEILTRVLGNLKGIYQAKNALDDLEWVLRMRLALPQVPRGEAVELGELLAAQGRFVDGALAIEQVAEESTEPDELLAAGRLLRARLN